VRPRSAYEAEQTGEMRFPYSPGNLVIERLGELVELAKEYRTQFAEQQNAQQDL
jgi:hypothetical protein